MGLLLRVSIFPMPPTDFGPSHSTRHAGPSTPTSLPWLAVRRCPGLSDAMWTIVKLVPPLISVTGRDRRSSTTASLNPRCPSPLVALPLVLQQHCLPQCRTAAAGDGVAASDYMQVAVTAPVCTEVAKER
jgi:hypothetical protein